MPFRYIDFGIIQDNGPPESGGPGWRRSEAVARRLVESCSAVFNRI
jgi:hypothetical protein